MEEKEKRYVVSYPLYPQPWQERIIDTWLKHCEMIYNICNSMLFSVYNRPDVQEQLAQFDKSIRELGKNDQKARKEIYSQRTTFLNSLAYTDEKGITSNATKGTHYSAFTEYGIYNLMNNIIKLCPLGNNTFFNHLGKRNITINTKMTKELASRLFSAWEKFLFKNGKKIRRKGKDNPMQSMKMQIKDSARFVYVDTNDHTLHIKIGSVNRGKEVRYITMPYHFSNTEYEIYAEKEQEIDEIGIKTIFVRGKKKYYLVITYKGIPFGKYRQLGKGNVGIDPGVSSITSYGKTVTQFTMEKIKYLEEKETQMQRYLDRSRRLSNPDNYNADGTIRKTNKKLVWTFSKRYIKARSQHKELKRKIAAKRKRIHIEWANNLLTQGNVFNVEKNNILSWAKKSTKPTEIGKNGRCKSKKKYGKSIGNTAPAQALSILKNKVLALGGTYNEIPEIMAATATDHTRNFQRSSRPLPQRRVQLSNGIIHDRDTHAAFNLKHFNVQKKNYDLKEMENDYDNFCKEEKKIWEKLKYQKNS